MNFKVGTLISPKGEMIDKSFDVSVETKQKKLQTNLAAYRKEASAYPYDPERRKAFDRLLLSVLQYQRIHGGQVEGYSDQVQGHMIYGTLVISQYEGDGTDRFWSRVFSEYPEFSIDAEDGILYLTILDEFRKR